MVFSSTVFLFVFLPIAFIMHLLLPKLWMKNAWLIAASLVFYAYGEPLAVLLMVASTLANYLLARLLSGRYRKLVLVTTVFLNLGVLVIFKYLGFFAQVISGLTGIELAVPMLSLPVGISFFTFQAMSYVLDVYNGTCPVQKRYSDILLYVSFFPQLIAGPIVKYHDIEEQIHVRTVTAAGCATGLRRFTCGLAKKLLIANSMAFVADQVFALDEGLVNLPVAWLGAIAYTLQIYFDFSGYSDMAIGLGHCFGFTFLENFNYPLAATGMRDFWRKWHISLTTWFREYLYIPLGGNRKGAARKRLNTMIVFFLTGLWHGANFTFIVWGVLNGAALLVEDAFSKKENRSAGWRRIYTIPLVVVLFTLFRADTLSQGFSLTGKMLAGYTFTPQQMSVFFSYCTPLFLVTLAGAILLAGGAAQKLGTRLLEQRTSRVAEVLSYGGCLVLLFLCIVNLSSASYNPFIYFRF